MNKARRFHAILQTATVAGAVTLRYELVSSTGSHPSWAPWPGWVITLMTLALGVGVAEVAGRIAVRIRWVRRWVLGGAWLEGAWLLKTYDFHDESKPLTVGVMQISYRSHLLRPVVSVYNPKGIRSPHERYSKSRDVVINEQDLWYINYLLSADGPENLVALAIGVYHRDAGSRYSRRYFGKFMYLDSQDCYRQVGEKLPAEKVESLKERHELDWFMVIADEAADSEEAPDG